MTSLNGRLKAVLLLIVLILYSLFILKNYSLAGSVTITTAPTLSNNAVGAISSYTVNFTPQTNVSSGGKVLVRFIFPWNFSYGLSGATRNGSTSAQITTVDTSQAVNNVLIFTTTGLTGGSQYTIKVDNVQNPTTAGMGLLAIATQTSEGVAIDGNVMASTPSSLSPSFEIGTAAFKGRITNPSSQAVSDAYVNIFPQTPGSGASPAGSASNYNGDYLISTTNVNSGSSYILEVYPPYTGGGNMVSPDRQTRAYNGTAITQNFQFGAATKTISGTMTYSDNGNPVANATINAFKMNGSGFANTTTNSSGVYSLLVGGGNWGVMPQASGSANWAYGDKPQEAFFASDATEQSQTVNFSVYRASATITGTLLKPNGQAINPQSDGVGGVGFFSQEGRGAGGQLQSDGTFSIAVPAGTYMFNVWTPPESSYGSPSLSPITVKDNETKNIGNVTLVNKDATITGYIRNSGGTGIANVTVNAFIRDGAGFSMATTNGSGAYTMSVTSGRWMVMPIFSYNDNYALNDPPQEVSVSSGGIATVNFTAQSASATINGTLVNSDGAPVSIYGYAFAETSGGSMFGPGGLGGPIERGNFSFKAPPGTYTVKVGLAPGSGYTPGDGTAVTLADGATSNITVTLKNNDATITGSILDENGTAVTNSGLFVFAISGGDDGHTFQQGTVTGSSYSIAVAAGDWSIGYFLNPSTGYMSEPPSPNMKITITAGQTVTKNISLKSANATISGIVTKPNGTAANGVFVSVDNRETEGKSSFNGSPTDSNGAYSVRITSGTYKVRVNVPPGSGFLSPTEQNVTVSANSTQNANFTLRQSDATISGNVTISGNGTSAFVYAWAEDGGFAQTMSSSSGAYSLSVSKNTIWHVGAHYESSTTPYEASEVAVNMTGATATANLTLTQSSFTLPQSVTTVFDSTKPKLISLTDGTEINIPAGALATSGNVTLTINPKASLPTKKGDKPLWYGYEFTATNANSQTISNFNSSITITFPYTDAQLTRLGITADDLIPSYWDETTATWKKVSNVTINTSTHTVTITIDHFTDFALTANATTSSSSTTATASSTSGSGSSGGAKTPEVYSNGGAVIKKEQATIIVSENTVPYDSYVKLSLYPKKHPIRFLSYWQVSDRYDLYFQSFFNDAKILNPAKSTIVAIKYTKEQLGKLPEKSLKLAYSLDEGKSWKILRTSVLDKNNRTVAALTKLGGQYMLVAGFGGYYPTDGLKYVPGKTIDKKEVKGVQLQEQQQVQVQPRVDTNKFTPQTLPLPKSPQKSILRKIIDFIF